MCATQCLRTKFTTVQKLRKHPTDADVDVDVDVKIRQAQAKLLLLTYTFLILVTKLPIKLTSASGSVQFRSVVIHKFLVFPKN